MGHYEQSDEELMTAARPRVRRARLGASAVALVLAAMMAACGGSDSSSDTTTSASSGTTATQAATKTTSAVSNGVADKSAEQILTAANEAARGATAVHVTGTADGVELDLSFAKGKGASGSVEQLDNRFELITVGDEIFLKGSDEYYRGLGGDAVVTLLSGKWLKVPSDTRGFEGFAQLTDMDALLTGMLRPQSSAIKKGKVETIDGTEVIGLGGRRGTLYVATTGKPFPFKIDRSDDTGAVTFDRWNEPVELTAPTDVVDVAELERVQADATTTG